MHYKSNYVCAAHALWWSTKTQDKTLRLVADGQLEGASEVFNMQMEQLFLPYFEKPLYQIGQIRILRGLRRCRELGYIPAKPSRCNLCALNIIIAVG